MPERPNKNMKNRRQPCTRCARPTKRQSAVCAECSPPAQGKRPERPCTGCGKRTTAKSGECRACEPTYMRAEPVTDEHAIKVPGEWVTIRGVRRYVTPKTKAA